MLSTTVKECFCSIWVVLQTGFASACTAFQSCNFQIRLLSVLYGWLYFHVIQNHCLNPSPNQVVVLIFKQLLTVFTLHFSFPPHPPITLSFISASFGNFCNFHTTLKKMAFHQGRISVHSEFLLLHHWQQYFLLSLSNYPYMHSSL